MENDGNKKSGKRDIRKLISVSFFFVLLLFAYSAVQNAPVLSDAEYSYLGSITWYNSLEKGLEVARIEDKPILVYFWAVWCTFCEKLETEVFPDERIKSILEEEFVLVAIDLDVDRDISSAFGVSYPPAEVFLDSSGNEVHRVPGYVDVDTFYPVILEILKEKGD